MRPQRDDAKLPASSVETITDVMLAAIRDPSALNNGATYVRSVPWAIWFLIASAIDTRASGATKSVAMRPISSFGL